MADVNRADDHASDEYNSEAGTTHAVDAVVLVPWLQAPPPAREARLLGRMHKPRYACLRAFMVVGEDSRSS